MKVRGKFEWTCPGCGKHFEKTSPLGMRLAIRNHTRACLERVEKAAKKGLVQFVCANGHICYRGAGTLVELAPGCDECGMPLRKLGSDLPGSEAAAFLEVSAIDIINQKEAENLAVRMGLLKSPEQLEKEVREIPELRVPYRIRARDNDVRFPVTITEGDLEDVMNCEPCDSFKVRGCCDDSCEKYHEYLFEKYPVVESPPDAKGKCWIEVMNGMIPKEIVDEYVNQTLDRLRTLRKPMDEYDRKRLLWRVDGMEDTRRALHYAVLKAAGFTPLDVSPDAMAFKIVIEHYIEQRCHRLGGF